MKIGIVILSWNSRTFIDDCLNGLFQFEPEASVYVVDNGSTDDSANYVAMQYPRAALIRSPWNLGFGSGNNVGIERAIADGCEAILLLNNDTVIDEPFLAPCVAALAHEPKLGIVGPVIVDADRPEVIQCVGGRIGLWTLDFAYRGKGRRYTRNNRCDRVGYVLGAAMLIRRAVIERIGMFDPDYFPAYVEEADYCHRARLAGYASAVCHSSRVRHVGEQSSGGAEQSFRRFTANRLRFGLKHLDPIRFLVASQCVAWHAAAHKAFYLSNAR